MQYYVVHALNVCTNFKEGCFLYIQIDFIHERTTFHNICIYILQLLASELGWSKARAEAEQADGMAFLATFCGPVPKYLATTDTIETA